MDTIGRVEVFLKVVECGGFAPAARQLGMTGPALSKQVQQLEDKLGVRLLHRTTRQVSLSDAGALYYEKVRHAVDALREAEVQLQEDQAEPSGRLRVNVPVSFGRQYLAEPLAAFAAVHPKIQMQVDFDDRRVDVVGEGVDLVVRIGALEDSSLIQVHLAPCPIIACASPKLVRQYGMPTHPSELEDWPAIFYHRHGQDAYWRYGNVAGETGKVRLKEAFSANQAEMMVEAALQGLGVVLLPIFSAAPYLESGALVQLLPDYESEPKRGIYALYPERHYLPMKVRALMDALKNCRKDFPW
jgi:DNA-binding transcriptional LysR family regulator